MFKRLMFALALVLTLYACSKKDDSAQNHSATPPTSAADSSKDAPGIPADNTANGAGRLEPEAGTPKEAAVPRDAQENEQKKQERNLPKRRQEARVL